MKYFSQAKVATYDSQEFKQIRFLIQFEREL
jgi:hypothetical protein